MAASKSKNWVGAVSDTWHSLSIIAAIAIASVAMIFYLQTYFVSATDLDKMLQKTALVTELQINSTLDPLIKDMNLTHKEIDKHLYNIDASLIQISAKLKIK